MVALPPFNMVDSPEQIVAGVAVAVIVGVGVTVITVVGVIVQVVVTAVNV